MNLRSTAPLVVCPPTGDPVMMALTMAEETAHRAGWDAPLAVHILHRLPPGDRMAVTAPTHFDNDVAALHPLGFLHLLYHRLDADSIDPSVLAIILIAEADVTYSLAADVAALGEEAPLHTERARSAFLAALAGRDIHLVRYRGEKPEEQHSCPVHGPDPIALMLRRIADKVARVLAARGH